MLFSFTAEVQMENGNADWMSVLQHIGIRSMRQQAAQLSHKCIYLVKNSLVLKNWHIICKYANRPTQFGINPGYLNLIIQE